MIIERQFPGVEGDVSCEVLVVNKAQYNVYKHLNVFKFNKEYNVLELNLNDFAEVGWVDEYEGLPLALLQQIAEAISIGAELLHVELSNQPAKEIFARHVITKPNRKTVVLDTDLPQYALLDLHEYNVEVTNDILQTHGVKYISDRSDVSDTIILFSGIITTGQDTTNIFRFNRVVNVEREHDIDMLLNIDKSNILKAPTWHYHTRGALGLLPSIPYDKRVMVKPFMQARSIGKHIFNNKTEILNFLNIINGNAKINEVFPESDVNGYYDYTKLEMTNELYKLFKIDKGHCQSHEEHIMMDHLASHRYYLSEVVDFTYEFRVLYFAGTTADELVVELREGYCPGDKTERKHSVVTDLSEIIGSELATSLVTKAKAFGDYTIYPALSLDIYVNVTTNDIGMFEYSQEFGVSYDDVTLRKISKQYTAAIVDAIETAI